MSYCSLSRRRRFTVQDLKSWAYSLIYGHFQRHLYCACAEMGYLWTSGVNLDTAVRPQFPTRVENFGDSATFSVDFCILYLNVRHIYTSGLFYLLTYKIIPHASTTTSIIPTKFKVDMTIHCRVIAFCLLIRHVTLWPWLLTFWGWTVAVHGESL